LIFLAAAVLLLGALGLVAFDPWDSPADSPETPAVIASSGPAAAAEDPAVLAPVAAPMRAPDPETVPVEPPPIGQKLGAIRGNISLAAGVVAELRFVYVKIEEAISRPGGKATRLPFVKTTRVDIVPELGTPEFFYDGIPFSEYGYIVLVYAAGVNGSKQFVHVTKEHPTADVMLSVTEAHPFTVLLRDQRKTPVPGKRVYMLPLGEPKNRRVLQKESDSYGAAVFDKVLAGDYEVRVGSLN